jgi:E3 ubiquitin-protein ligase KEG
VFAGTLSRGSRGARRCKHPVAVKRVPLSAADDLEAVKEEVERLRRSSSWLQNVCAFHGAMRVGGHLCFVMDRYAGSVQEEMRQNGGRLTLEQILRCGIASSYHGYQLVILVAVELVVIPHNNK